MLTTARQVRRAIQTLGHGAKLCVPGAVRTSVGADNRGQYTVRPLLTEITTRPTHILGLYGVAADVSRMSERRKYRVHVDPTEPWTVRPDDYNDRSDGCPYT